MIDREQELRKEYERLTDLQLQWRLKTFDMTDDLDLILEELKKREKQTDK
jgi:hypothetical protein